MSKVNKKQTNFVIGAPLPSDHPIYKMGYIMMRPVIGREPPESLKEQSMSQTNADSTCTNESNSESDN